MADADGFVVAVDVNGNKHRVPEHYLDNPAMGYKLPPSARTKEPATPAKSKRVTEPAVPENEQEVSE